MIKAKGLICEYGYNCVPKFAFRKNTTSECDDNVHIHLPLKEHCSPYRADSQAGAYPGRLNNQ